MPAPKRPKDYVATENISQQGYVPDMRMSGMRAPDCTDHLLARVLEESEVKGDLTLPDGRVVPAVYVRLRNRLNRIGNGCGSECRPSSWDLYMYKLDEEQAEILCKVPMLAWFTAEDLEAVSDYTHEEAVQKLDEIAFGGMIAYQDRSGKRYYVLQPYIAGYWEATELIDYYKGGEDVMAAYDVLSQDGLGADYGFQLTANTFALNTVDPISLDVIAEDDFLPYMDWRKRILSNEIVGVAACQCRIMNKAIDGWEENGRFEMDRCIYLGASGEYFINIGAAKQVTPEEAVEDLRAQHRRRPGTPARELQGIRHHLLLPLHRVHRAAELQVLRGHQPCGHEKLQRLHPRVRPREVHLVRRLHRLVPHAGH